MTGFWQLLSGQAVSSSVIELIAVILAISYLLLAVKQQIWCWPAAFLSSLIYLYVFFEVQLYMESMLQVYYAGMAVYGWQQWQKKENDQTRPIRTWPLRQHLISLVLILAGTYIAGRLLVQTDARLPYIDAFTTVASVLTTYMVTQKILENWIYWLVIDLVSIFLYLDRALYFTALLFCIYIVIIGFGWLQWLTLWRASRPHNLNQ
ncbi:MAG TPA: nicotinamide riboside transporter PnuC [Gammaproteobacteria bacterium]|nr:nicotinamide riboside transporter PnuC [Gammaproteobacteria bacterium]HIK69759.1 nicotinamide riboside transporter PnuC [Pseudomonadales bacterium]